MKYFEYLRGLQKVVPKKRFTDPTLRMSFVEIVQKILDYSALED